MKCLILAAGYATRLYPLTENFPKPLLKVGKKCIIDWIIDDLDNLGVVSEIIIVSNHKFIRIFEEWQEGLKCKTPVTVIDDGTTDNANRMGAVRDIAFAIESCGIQEDLLVVAGDNLLDFSLKGFIDYFFTKKCSCVMRHFESNVEKLQKTGVAVIDEEDRIVKMQEKPEIPESSWAVPPFYIYKEEDLEMILYATKNRVCNTDAPGDFLVWLCERSDICAYLMPGSRYDIGTLESYYIVQSKK